MIFLWLLVACLPMTLLHRFPDQLNRDDLPEIFPSPFANQPHPVAKLAASLLMQQLESDQLIDRDFFSPPSSEGKGGKMFGVLVVLDKQGEPGYLCAFSGMMSGAWEIEGFVPPVFNIAEQDRFLTSGKAELALLAEQLEILEHSPRLAQLKDAIAKLEATMAEALQLLKHKHKAAKALRKQQRKEIANLPDKTETEQILRSLALDSQHNKREMTDAKQYWHEQLQPLKKEIEQLTGEISQLRELRTSKSQELHQQVFSSYLLANFHGEQLPLTTFFDPSTPPSGSADCTAPKLLQYAQKNDLKPVALAEFWWGSSPAAGIRHHRQFYPACRGKCHPIIPFMLKGLNAEAEPFYGNAIDQALPAIIYEDDFLLVVDKPSGLMSEPGKEIKDSVFTRLQQRFPHLPELRLVHRLDMCTSGLLLVAKDTNTYKRLQRQFIRRTVEKRYEAILCKRLPADKLEGDIDLPLRVDFDDRPRQLVCYEYGKPARTHWQVIGYEGDTTRVWFYPHTGRTHQLRVHASHRDGLNAAIIGDDLYGLAGERLMLHAQRLCFDHPQSRERLEFELPAPF